MRHRSLAVVILAVSSHAYSVEVERYVGTSWLPVMSSPDSGRKTVANWPANTRVTVESQRGAWCRATAVASSGWVRCESLLPGPMALGKLELKANEGDSDAALQAFWVAPSAGRLARAGSQLDEMALSTEQKERQDRLQRAIRFTLAQFEAMKGRLQEGIVPRFKQEVERFDLETGTRLVDGGAASSDIAGFLRAAGVLGVLPIAHASLFQSQQDVLLFPDSSPDAIVAMQGHPARIAYAGKPVYVVGQYDAGVNGIWDIGEIRVRYAHPAQLGSVGRDGSVGGRVLEGATLYADRFGHGECEDVLSLAGYGRKLPGVGEVQKDEQLLAAVYLRNSRIPKRADVRDRKARIGVPAHSPVFDDAALPTYRDVIVHDIDLDRDGNADLAIVELLDIDGTLPTTHSRRWQFINVRGRWWYAGEYRSDECD